MLEAIGTGLGGLLGSALGGLGDVMSAPARGLRTLLGMPETGGHFTEGLGLDPNSLATSAVGFGYDVLTDPLTFLGGAIGRLGSRALGGGNNLERAALARGPRYGASIAEDVAAAPTSLARQPRPGGIVFKSDPDVLRMDQLNSPTFNPELPTFNLGTKDFTQSQTIDRLQRLTAPDRIARPPASRQGALLDRLSRLTGQASAF